MLWFANSLQQHPVIVNPLGPPLRLTIIKYDQPSSTINSPSPFVSSQPSPINNRGWVITNQNRGWVSAAMSWPWINHPSNINQPSTNRSPSLSTSLAIHESSFATSHHYWPWSQSSHYLTTITVDASRQNYVVRMKELRAPAPPAPVGDEPSRAWNDILVIADFQGVVCRPQLTANWWIIIIYHHNGQWIVDWWWLAGCEKWSLMDACLMRCLMHLWLMVNQWTIIAKYWLMHRCLMDMIS